MITVFLTATYWFLNLLGFSAFDFAAPLAEVITNFIHSFHNEEVQIGGVFFDGSLLLYDLVAVGLVYGATKLKINLLIMQDKVFSSIESCERHIENKFNENLEKDLKHEIMKCNNSAFLIKFSCKSMLVDAFWGGDEKNGVKEKEEEAFKAFYARIKNLNGCKFAKTDNTMLIMCNDFEKTDVLLKYIDASINYIRAAMAKQKWKLHSYVSVDVYDNKTDFKEVYAILEKLTALKIFGEALCLGNFCMRYDMSDNVSYEPVLKGTYSIGQETDVWSLVKKN